MRFSDNDFVLRNGYMAKGDPIAICGPAGVGKSRLVMQLAIDVLIGREFLGWTTKAREPVG
jgi:RecA-family ATPase